MEKLYYDRENKKFYVREIITEKNGDILIATDEKYVDVTDEIVTLRSQPKQERQIKKGDKVSIHCRKDREEYIIAIYDGKVGEVTDVWDKRYPWGHIAVKLDNGCNNSFHEDELEVLDEPYYKTWEEAKSENNVDINRLEKDSNSFFKQVHDSIIWDRGLRTGMELGFNENAKNNICKSKVFTIEEIENFVHDHIQQKIDNDELHLTGIGNDNFEREFMIYRNALFEGIVNGISMCNNKVEGIEDNLKSFRPQPKRDCKDCAMFLNGKCTKPHWKPSEEQMEALNKAIPVCMGVVGQDAVAPLESLCEQLEKLM